ncbi:hypothetical protein [Pararhodobacter aggregans]|uniref:hypothetical protein n=1 Tax=Pararhodobacter aggregans TaxID=404875 RepID=UPI000D48652D|nr:hypothetical protein [Pararhodobacter aggregans]PTX03370.1 hypothetical protein C8N33_103172 [Pararhodobacter aggregans]
MRLDPPPSLYRDLLASGMAAPERIAPDPWYLESLADRAEAEDRRTLPREPKGIRHGRG